ncbi:Sfi1 spindle body protein-domain-containing protein [Diplogelasinospora grovesii]|uniref:Sfi1 spindle body protein-domain-containing protein n=1 Tax=Diplogelasinospora grovesii TaxID=303347 RepID=A0AAN6S8K3_9PEZI|nr:Sfi1 spindle body protein-domain-containing protein [Diplogelasinospora grovesii]
MPPQSSLPLRDGRAGFNKPIQRSSPPHVSVPNSSSYLQNEPSMYSDDDIKLLHDIVTLGEAIYPTLPERDRLPTNALFQAAEQVLPAHGYDPDQDAPSHITRLIFKIGGQRSGTTLSDKFRSVLGGMGIRLELVNSSSIEQSPASAPFRSPAVSRTASSRSSLRSSTQQSPEGGETQTATGTVDNLPLRRPMQYLHRRSPVPRSALRSPLSGQQSPADTPGRLSRSRSVSFVDPDPSSSPDNARRPPTRNGNVPHGLQRKESEGARRQSPTKVDSEVVRRPSIIPYIRNHVGGERHHPDKEIVGAKEGVGQDLNHRRFPTHIPAPQKISGSPRAFGHVQKEADGHKPDGRQALEEAPEITRETEVDQDPPQLDGSDSVHDNASEATIQSEGDTFRVSFQDELPPAHTHVSLDLLESRQHQFEQHYAGKLMEHAFSKWRTAAQESMGYTREQETCAIEMDDIDMVAEVLDVWQEEAAFAKEERLRAQAAADHELNYIMKMEKRAKRVYEIFTIRNVLAHWQDCAQDEVDRIAVARRHLVRKRAFDGWRAQHVEDESKVTNFILYNALQKWTQVNLLHEVREHVANQHYDRNLIKDSLQVMRDDYKGRLADEYHETRLIQSCLQTWFIRRREVVDEYEVAVALDERLLLDEVVNIWHEETEDLQYTAYDCTVQKLAGDCRRVLSDWQEQTRLNMLLRQWSAKQDTRIEYRVLSTWHSAVLEAKRTTEFADVLFVEDKIDRWNCEAKLKFFTACVEEETKRDTLGHWALEEKLAWFKRHSENGTKYKTLHILHSAAKQTQAARVQAQEEADYVSTTYTEYECIDTWYAQTEAMWRHGHNANLVSLYRTTKPCLDTWQERYNRGVARKAYARREADKNARKLTLSSVLGTWPGIAKQTKRDRLMSTLRQYRRQYKVDLASSCLGRWWSAAAEANDLRRDANDIHLEHKREDVNDYLDFWSYTAGRAQNIRQIAADAELEVYIGEWAGHLYEAREDEQDAIDYDTDKTLGQCWKKWEFQNLQQEGRKNAVAAVRDRNEKRWCSQVLEDWHQRAVPETALDPRASTLSSRRSVRQHQYLSRSAVVAPLPPYYAPTIPTIQPTFSSVQVQIPDRTRRFNQTLPRGIGAAIGTTPQAQFPSVSQLGMGRTRTPAIVYNQQQQQQQLGPMAEFDEDSFVGPDEEMNDPGFMSTPTKWTGSARPLGYRPTTTPSAILPSPYERELRQTYGSTGAGHQTTRPVRTVEFADIREESAEL